MPTRHKLLIGVLSAGLIVMAGCAANRKIAKPKPFLTLVQNSQRLLLEVAEDGHVNLAEHPPLQGRIDIGPILATEGQEAGSLQALLHLGRYYLVAEGFRNLWEVTPQPGGSRANYRPIAVTGEPLSGVRLSRYGPAGRACVRVDIEEGGVWFVSSSGVRNEECR